MDKEDSELLDLFKRYSNWLASNNLKDTITNYKVYLEYIEKADFTYGD